MDPYRQAPYPTGTTLTHARIRTGKIILILAVAAAIFVGGEEYNQFQQPKCVESSGIWYALPSAATCSPGARILFDEFRPRFQLPDGSMTTVATYTCRCQ